MTHLPIQPCHSDSFHSNRLHSAHTTIFSRIPKWTTICITYAAYQSSLHLIRICLRDGGHDWIRRWKYMHAYDLHVWMWVWTLRICWKILQSICAYPRCVLSRMVICDWRMRCTSEENICNRICLSIDLRTESVVYVCCWYSRIVVCTCFFNNSIYNISKINSYDFSARWSDVHKCAWKPNHVIVKP